MDLKPTAHQQQLVDAFAGFLRGSRDDRDGEAAEPLGHDPGLWQRLLHLGAIDMAVPDKELGYEAPTWPGRNRFLRPDPRRSAT